MKYKRQKGQVMLMTTLILSSAILSATTFAGLLVLFQLRQASDITASMKAIFAADSGIECALLVRFENGSGIPSPQPDYEERCKRTLNNGSEYKTILTDSGAVKSVGRFKGSARAFEIRF